MSIQNFEIHYKKYYPKVLYFFLHQGLSREDACDLSQETFLRLFKNREDFRGETSMGGWIDIIKKSVWCNYLRAKKTKKREALVMSLEEKNETDYLNKSSTPSPEIQLMKSGQKEILRKAISQLPGRTRHVVYLRTYHELPFSEIATILKSTVQTVKSQNSQAKKMLEQLLAETHKNITL